MARQLQREFPPILTSTPRFSVTIMAAAAVAWILLLGNHATVESLSVDLSFSRNDSLRRPRHFDVRPLHPMCFLSSQGTTTARCFHLMQSTASSDLDLLLDQEELVDSDDANSGNRQDLSTMEQLETLDTMEVKRRLLDLVPRMTGTRDEFRQVEMYVNTLEARYMPVQTLEFLNLALSGEWQLLFSTNLLGGRKPYFRLRKLCQQIEAEASKGSIINVATWDLANDLQGGDNKALPPSSSSSLPTPIFDASGTFSIKCSYSINQGARMVIDLDDHVLELAKGSAVPKDVEGLVGLLHRSVPKEMFDPSDHAMDTTYLDGDLRIVRMTGPRLESVRDIFIRSGSMEINPV